MINEQESRTIKRPKMLNEALELFDDGIEIEVENEKLFETLDYFKKVTGRISFSCNVNGVNAGWTTIQIKKSKYD